MDSLALEVLEAAREWHSLSTSVKQELKITGSYGVREYRRGAVINYHTDPAETQPLTAIVHLLDGMETDYYCSAEKTCLSLPRLKESRPWLFEIAIVDEDVVFSGKSPRIEHIALRSGEAILFESAKRPHSRSTPLSQDFFGNAFVHLAPRKWEALV